MIKDFIKNNSLSFEEGNRNITCTILVGYAQHLGLGLANLKSELKDEINADSFIEEELNRLYPYCKTNNYKDYWDSKRAKREYKF